MKILHFILKLGIAAAAAKLIYTILIDTKLYKKYIVTNKIRSH